MLEKYHLDVPGLEDRHRESIRSWVVAQGDADFTRGAGGRRVPAEVLRNDLLSHIRRFICCVLLFNHSSSPSHQKLNIRQQLVQRGFIV